MHLATSAWLMYVFWIDGIPFHTLIDLLVTNLFYVHARHQMIEAARRDKNGVLLSEPWSVGHLLSDAMSALCRSPNQPIRRSQEHQSMFLNISSQAENCEASVLENCFWPCINPSPKDLQAL